MTYCVDKSKGPCHCQPDEGRFCGFDSEVAGMQEGITTLRSRLDEKTTQCVRWAAHAKNLESQLEQERARVAELEKQEAVLQLSELMRGLEIGPGFASMPPYIFYVTGKHIADQAKQASDAATLRKQAEAVEEAYKSTVLTQTIDDPYSDFGKGQDFGFDQAVTQFDEQMEKQVSHLRNQADEAEKGGE